jgi:transcriptional regulator with XRE-family HTH domain
VKVKRAKPHAMKKARKATARNQIGSRIRQARRRCKPTVSQDDLAGRLGAQGILLDRSAISRIETRSRYLMDYGIAALAGAGDDARYFQISVPVQPGNSGGALVDEHGNVVGIVSAKLNAAAALASSGALPENVNYAVKSSFLLSFLESVPDVAKKLEEPSTADRKFEDVVKSAQAATVLVLVY